MSPLGRFLALAAAGVAAVLAGLAWDGFLHASDPALHEESPFTLANPSHVCLLAGIAAAAVGVGGAAWVAMAASDSPLWSSPVLRAGLVVAGVGLAGVSALAGVQARRSHDRADRVEAGAAAPAPPAGEVAPAHGHQAPAGRELSSAFGGRDSEPPEGCRPTQAERTAASRLVDGTRGGLARYPSLQAARAEGFRPVTPEGLSTVHYLNPAYVGDGRVLDPSRPEVLVYANTVRGPKLAGAMYLADSPGQPGPAVGGCLTEWHSHDDLCFDMVALQVAAFTRPDGTCPPGQVHYVPPPMMHVWVVDVPGGPFAHDVDGPALARRLGS